MKNIVNISLLISLILINVIKIYATNYNSGYFYTQVYEEFNRCSSSALTFSEGFALNTCITTYNTLGNPMRSFKYACDQTTATITNYTSTNCEDASISFTYELDVCNNVSTSSGLNTGTSIAFRCILSTPAVTTNNLPIFMNSVVNIGYPDYNVGCNGDIITFTAMATSICYNSIYNNDNDYYSLLTCNDSYTLKTNYNSNNCSNLTSSNGYILYNNDVCLIDNNLFNNTNQINSKDICYFPYNVDNDDTGDDHHAGYDDGSGDDGDDSYYGSYYYGYYSNDDSISASPTGYVYYQYYDFIECQGNIKKVIGYINNQCLLINELYIPAVAISYSITGNSINMTQYSDSNCDESSIHSNEILNFNSCYREPNDGYYYKVFYSDSVLNSDHVDNLPETDQTVVLSGYGKSSSCNSNIISFKAVPLNTCVFVTGEATSYEYTCDSDNLPFVTEYYGAFCSNDDIVGTYQVDTLCKSDNTLYDDDYELDVSIYSKTTCNVPLVSSSSGDSFFTSQLGVLVLIIAIVALIFGTIGNVFNLIIFLHLSMFY
jgi:hypothetical protein